MYARKFGLEIKLAQSMTSDRKDWNGMDDG